MPSCFGLVVWLFICGVIVTFYMRDYIAMFLDIDPDPLDPVYYQEKPPDEHSFWKALFMVRINTYNQ